MAATVKVLEALQQLSDEQWALILKKLTLYADYKLDNLGFQPRTEFDSVDGEDFVQEAIKRVIEGTRKWNIDKHPDFLIFLKMVVKSLILNHLKQSINSPVKITDISAIYNEEDQGGIVSYMEYASTDEVLISTETWQKIEVAFGEDIEGFIFFCDWLDNLSPKVIATNYNIDVTFVYKPIKKGKGIVKKLFAS